ncbi:MAG: dTMP kinase [Acidilobaceae archaeon]
MAVEGIDGSGLTTHSKLLVERLKKEGFKAIYTKEPTWSPIGSLIRELLYSDQPLDSDIMALLYAADRLWHLRVSSCVGPGVLKLLEEGYLVISDRYKYSNVAYQGIKSGADWVELLNSRAPEADLVIYIDVPVSIALSRIKERPSRAYYETKERLEEIKKALESVLKKVEARGVKVIRVEGVSPTGSPRPIEEVHEEVYSKVVKHIRGRL